MGFFVAQSLFLHCLLSYTLTPYTLTLPLPPTPTTNPRTHPDTTTHQNPD